ncbi:hypothetical protein, partial [Photobacterium sanguinicancri]|uniref:hypothetical protein n=1 Tax=Photobacterium sanguinicancri TaxID=875932 RepID=UPI0026E14AB1
RFWYLVLSSGFTDTKNQRVLGVRISPPLPSLRLKQKCWRLFRFWYLVLSSGFTDTKNQRVLGVRISPPCHL